MSFVITVFLYLYIYIFFFIRLISNLTNIIEIDCFTTANEMSDYNTYKYITRTIEMTSEAKTKEFHLQCILHDSHGLSGMPKMLNFPTDEKPCLSHIKLRTRFHHVLTENQPTCIKSRTNSAINQIHPLKLAQFEFSKYPAEEAITKLLHKSKSYAERSCQIHRPRYRL